MNKENKSVNDIKAEVRQMERIYIVLFRRIVVTKMLVYTLCDLFCDGPHSSCAFQLYPTLIFFKFSF